jgi:hypothetical protein
MPSPIISLLKLMAKNAKKMNLGGMVDDVAALPWGDVAKGTALTLGGGAVATSIIQQATGTNNAGPYQYTPPTTYQYKASDDVLTLAQQYGTTPQAIIDMNPGGWPFDVGQTVKIPGVKLPTTDDSWAAPKTLPQAAPAGIQPTPAGNTDYSQTQAAQNYARNNTPFTDQLRFDPQTKKYVSLGRLIKQGKLDLRGNWHKTAKRNHGGNRRQQSQQAETKQDMTLTNSFLTFGVGSG